MSDEEAPAPEAGTQTPEAGPQATGTDPQATDPGALSRVVKVLWSPGATFAAVVRRPAILAPLLVLLVLQGVAALAIYKPAIVPYTIERMEDAGKVPAEQIAVIQNRMESPLAMSIALLGGMLIGGVLSPLVWAAILYFVFTLLLSGRGDFKAVYSVCLYAAMTQIPHLLLRVPLVIARQDPEVTIGPASLMARPDPVNFVYALLQGLDIFGIWSWILAGIGLSVLYRKPLEKIWLPLACVFVVLLLAGAARIWIGQPGSS